MIRAVLYLLAAGVVWFVEGFLFSRFLAFSALQTTLAVGVYAVLYGIVVYTLITAFKRDAETGDVARWRHLSMAPMVTVVLGSFASLPVLLLIVALGKIG